MYCRDNPPHRYRSWHVVCFLVFLSWKQNITNYKNFSLNRSKTNWRLGAYFQTEYLTAKWVHFGILNTNPRISLQQKSSKLLTSLPRSCGVFFFRCFYVIFYVFFFVSPTSDIWCIHYINKLDPKCIEYELFTGLGNLRASLLCPR